MFLSLELSALDVFQWSHTLRRHPCSVISSFVLCCVLGPAFRGRVGVRKEQGEGSGVGPRGPGWMQDQCAGVGLMQTTAWSLAYNNGRVVGGLPSVSL